MCHSTCSSLTGWSTRIPLGIAHLCPAGMTVDGKTYGGAGRGVVCVRLGGGSASTGCKHGLARVAPAASREMLGGATLAGGHAEGGVRCQDDLHTAAPRRRQGAPPPTEL